MRSSARVVALKYLYSRLFDGCEADLTALKVEEKLSEKDSEFADKLIEACLEKKDKYLDDISRLSNGFHVDRIFYADKCALLIGMAELDNETDTDVPIIVNEAVNLSSAFSTEKSPSFVNGVLGKYAKEVRNV